MDNGDQLILSYAYPHYPINSQLTARHIKFFLGLYGVYMKVLMVYSVRSTSVPKANNTDVSMKNIK